jgi:rod shape-determining protein MreC
MQQIVNFFIRNKIFLLFLFLFSIAISLTIQSHSYHKSKFINSANFLTGGVYKSVNNIGQYFNLKEENLRLLEENNRLKTLLFNSQDTIKVDSPFDGNYRLVSAQVYKNSYSATNNYLTINKGEKDSIHEDLGVITSRGIVGIIDNTSNNYARVMSILNTNSSVSAELKNTDHFGELKWDTFSPEIIQLVDIPKQAPVTEGDTIITSGRSTIFPKNIPVGTVSSFKLDETENFYIVNVQLFNDMTNIGHVHIIRNLDSQEIKTLENLDE